MTTTTKRCYICDREIDVEEATRVVKEIDAAFEREVGEGPIFKWIDENLTHCQGPPENFVDVESPRVDGCVVVCETCWSSI